MCRVRITNMSNNYSLINSTNIETEIPEDTVPVLKQLFKQLNSTRTNACMPSISIVKL